MGLSGILGSVAPVLASALPGPLGDLAKSAIAVVLGKAPSSAGDVEKILATASPETLLKLKAADQQFAEQMKQLDIDLERLATEDRASARSMQVATHSLVPPILAASVCVFYFLSIGFLMKFQVADQNRDIIIQAVGTLGGGFMLVLGYYFGTSASSRTKDDTIKRLSS